MGEVYHDKNVSEPREVPIRFGVCGRNMLGYQQ